MDWVNLILMFVTVLISLTVHEAAHALFAKLGGDLTAYRGGQVTLNPLPHIQKEPFGMVIFPLLSLFMTNGSSCIGFASTPIDPIWAWHHPKRAALMSAAGPLANLALAAIAFLVLWAIRSPESGTDEAIGKIARAFLILNILLFVFNLLPLPPLDGAGVLGGLVPPVRNLYERMNQVPYFGIVVLILAINVVPMMFGPVFREIVGWLPHETRRWLIQMG